MRMRDVSSVRGKNNPNQTKPLKPNLWQAGLFFRPWGTVCACLRDEQRPSLSHCLSPFHVTAFPGSGSWRGLPKALGSSSAPQLCRSFSFLPEAELSAQLAMAVGEAASKIRVETFPGKRTAQISEPAPMARPLSSCRI